MKRNLYIITIFLLIFIPLSLRSLFSQEVPHSVNNVGIYEFLDELANAQFISINSVVKPYSRFFIARKLQEVSEKRDQLSLRQQKELDFYMMDFGKELNKEWRKPPSPPPSLRYGGQRRLRWSKGVTEERPNGKKTHWFIGQKGIIRRDLLYYRDSLFSLTLNPILGGELFFNSSGSATYWRNGAELRAYIGHWGFYASLRDNHEKPMLGLPEFLSQREGGHIKNETDWSEMRGGITYAWKWGSIGLIKDNIQWGNNNNGATIFGGRNPSVIQLRLHLYPVRWFDFNYFHGWLNSMVVDSARSYWYTNSYGSEYREKYHKKYIAANLFTFIPFKYLNISAGNSIIYDDSYFSPSYLMPLFFYKSVDHTVSSGIDNMNSQMFFDISSRQIKNLHIYATLFIDELSLGRITKKDEWNFVSWKAGFRLSNFPVMDLAFTTEFTYTYPLAYQHNVSTLTFESNQFNLGHYLKDNAREWYVAADYRPLRTLDIRLWFNDAIRGPDYTEIGVPRLGNPPLDTINWHNTSFGLKGSYQIINDIYVWLSYTNSDIRGDVRWIPGYLYGRRNTFNFGVAVGF